jgi:hypothetical protein
MVSNADKHVAASFINDNVAFHVDEGFCEMRLQTQRELLCALADPARAALQRVGS